MRYGIILLLLAQASAGAAERRQDFAYGMAVEADARDALYEIEIPAAVYRGVARADLGDLRVFNSQGEPVPHALRPSAAGAVQSGAAFRLPVFPLYDEAIDKPEDLNLRVEKRADGTVISIQSRAKGAEKRSRMSGYLIDASSVTTAIQTLHCEWQSDTAGFVGKVRIDGSDDLARWTNLADNAVLARLNFAGHQVEQNRVGLRAVKFKYLRISWPDNQAALIALSLRAEPAAQLVAAPRNWLKIAGSPVAGKAGEYIYDLGGYPPVDRLRVLLPQVNSLVQLQIHTRAKPDDPWRRTASAVAYRLRDRHTEVTSPEIAVTRNNQRYWLLSVDQKGGGVGSGVPELQVGWVAQKLVFAARGAGPFQLVYGSAGVKPAAFAIESLIPGYKTDAEFKVKTAALGKQVTLAGSAQLRAPWDYRKIALWGSLIAGVGWLGWMAYRLSRQMAKPPAESQKSDDVK